MTREELRNNYGNDICELCCRALPESLCEETEDSFADEHNIKLED